MAGDVDPMFEELYGTTAAALGNSRAIAGKPSGALPDLGGRSHPPRPGQRALIGAG